MTRRSRRFVRFAIAALLFAIPAGSYAWYRSYVAQQLAASLNNWILARTAEGYRIDADIAPESGGIATVARTLSNVAVGAPGDAWDLSLPRLDISVGTLSPFGVDFRPEGKLQLHYTVGDQDFTLTNDFVEARAGFSYDTDGAITSAHVSQSSSRLDGAVGIDLKSFQADASFDPSAVPSSDDKSIEFNLAFDDAIMRRSVNLPLGNSIKRAEIEGYVTGILQPGRPSESLAVWRDAGGVLQIQRFVANWGPLAITAEGTLTLDGQMQPLFAGTAIVRGYNETIDALAQAGMIELGQVTGAKIALAAMTKPADDGGPPAAKLPITIQDGFLFIGPLKLAQMPRIVWQ